MIAESQDININKDVNLINVKLFVKWRDWGKNKPRLGSTSLVNVFDRT